MVVGALLGAWGVFVAALWWWTARALRKGGSRHHPSG